MKKYVKIVLMVVITIQLEELSAMNWWPTSFSWGGSSSQTLNNNNNQSNERRIRPIIATASRFMQAYGKRTEDLSYEQYRQPKICWILAGRDSEAFQSRQSIKHEISRSIEAQNWKDESNHNANIIKAFGLIHEILCKNADPSKGLSLIVAIILESKIIVAHAGVAGFVLKKDRKEPIVSRQHHLSLNQDEETRLIELNAPMMRFSMLSQFLSPCKIGHDHNTDSYTIYYPSWNYSHVFDEYDAYDEKQEMPRKKCKSEKRETIVICSKNNTNAIEMITRGIGFSEFTPFITYIPEIFSHNTDGSEDFLILAGPTILDIIEPATLAVFVEQELFLRKETAQTVTKDIAFAIAESILQKLVEFAPDNRDLTLIIIFFT